MNDLIKFTVGTIKLKHNGFYESFIALLKEGSATLIADKNGYLNEILDFEKDFITDGKIIQAYSFKHCFEIIAQVEEKSKSNDRFRFLREENLKLKKALLLVFGDNLNGVHNDTKLNDLYKKGDKLENRLLKNKRIEEEKILKKRTLIEKKEKESDLRILQNTKIVSISTNPTERINDCGTPFTENTYLGCGNYWVAVKNNLIVASVKMDDTPIKNFQLFRDYCKNELSNFGDVVSGQGSGTQFFCKNSEDLKFFTEAKIYNVPAPYGDGNEGFVNTNFQAL